jgi:hypothetical protein
MPGVTYVTDGLSVFEFTPTITAPAAVDVHWELGQR